MMIEPAVVLGRNIFTTESANIPKVHLKNTIVKKQNYKVHYTP
jgi:hypothetical protein